MKRKWKLALILVLPLVALFLVLVASGDCGKRDPDLWGLFVIFEPADLVLYESLLQDPLGIPEQPLVGIYFINVPLPPIYYYEATVVVRAINLDDGIEAWSPVGLCVDEYVPWLGNVGLTGYWMKELADDLSIDPTSVGWKAEAILEDGRTWISLDFKRQDPPEDLKDWEKRFLIDNQMMLHGHLVGVVKNNMIGDRVTLSLDLDPYFPNRMVVDDEGIVKIKTASHHAWTRLLPPDRIAYAQFFRYTE